MFRPYALTLVFALFFFLLCAQTSWETVRIEDFSNVGNPASLTNISGLTQSGLSPSANGATGAIGDLCAGGTWTPGKYLSFQHQLETAYEYRITCNAKAAATNKKLQFAYGSSPGTGGQGYTAVGGLKDIAFTATTTIPGTDVVSEVFMIPSNGAYYITIAAAAGGSTSAFVRIDNYKLERKALPQPTRVYFASESLSVPEGESVEVCVNIENPANVATTVEVDLSGDGPHFPGFTPVTLTFPANSSAPQCFELTSVANNQPDQNLTYTLILQNLSGGFNASLSSPEVSTLVVEDDAPLPAECPWAGEDKVICMGESTTIGCPVVTGNDSYCFSWFEGNENTLIGSNASIEVSPSQTTTYTLVVTDGDGNIVASEDVVISVLNLPDVQIISDQPIACDGLNINTTLSATPAQENFTYQWHYAGWDEDDFLYTAEIVASLSGTYSLTITETHSIVSCSQEFSYELRDVNDSSSDSAIKDFFRAKQFLEIGITVTEDLPGFSGNELEGRSFLTTFIRDEADKLISIESNNINLSLSLQALFGREEFEGSSVTKGFITKNDNFCASSSGGNISLIQEIEAEFNASEAGIWMHIWENEDGEDCLFVKAQSPCQVDHSPVSAERAENMLAFFNLVKEEASFYSYPNKDEQLIDVLLDQVLDCYEGNVLDEEGTYAFESNSPPSSNPLPCDGLVFGANHFALNTAGLPIQLPQGSLMAEFGGSPLFDRRALTKFTLPDGNVYVSMRRGEYDFRHLGFRRPNRPKDPLYVFPAIANTSCLPTYLGEQSPNTSTGCTDFSVLLTNHTSNVTQGNSLPAGPRSGDYAPTFEPIGLPCSSSNDIQYLYSACIPSISSINFQSALEQARFNPFGQGGILFTITVDNQERFIYGRYEGLDPNSYYYYIWECELGGWVPFMEPDEESEQKMSVYVALYTAIYEIFTGQVSLFTSSNAQAVHLGLDIGGFIPVLGSFVDLVNGIWYIAEGNIIDGSFAFIGAIPILGDIVQGVRYTINLGQEGVRFVKMLGTSSNGVLSIGTLTRRILDYSTSGTPPVLNPDETKFLISWILDSGSSAARIGKLFDLHPGMLRVWRSMLDGGQDNSQRIRLIEWLVSTTDANIINRMINNPDNVQGWKLLDEIQIPSGSNVLLGRKTDIDLIEKTAEALSDAAFISRLGDDGRDVLKTIISNNKRARCKSCVTNGNIGLYLEPIDQYLDNARHFVNQYLAHSPVIPGADGLFSLMKNGQRYQIDEVNQTLRLLRSGGDDFAPALINRFSPPLGNIPDGLDDIGADAVAVALSNNNIGDIRFNGSPVKFAELKSFAKGSITGITGSRGVRFRQQFKAYLENDNLLNLSDLSYFFDAKKLVVSTEFPNAPFDNVDEAREFIAAKFKSIYANPNDGIFETIMMNESLRNNLFLNIDFTEDGAIDAARAAYNGMVSTLNPLLFNFIKLQ